jgi:hypothetical protein
MPIGGMYWSTMNRQAHICRVVSLGVGRATHTLEGELGKEMENQIDSKIADSLRPLLRLPLAVPRSLERTERAGTRSRTVVLPQGGNTVDRHGPRQVLPEVWDDKPVRRARECTSRLLEMRQTRRISDTAM